MTKDALHDRQEQIRWWIKLCVQPLLFLMAGAVLFAGLGVAQRKGWISSGGGVSTKNPVREMPGVRYICPMMCTPPQSEPGRCPVCAMELVPATSQVNDGNSRSIKIDPAARRIANIRTVVVRSKPVKRTIRAVGEISYDEGTLKTISAYVDGRLDRLYADFTGVVVKKGDQLALLYSPRLYSGQVELLLARRNRDSSRSSTLAQLAISTGDLYESARERLVLLGMTESQIAQLEESGRATSRMYLHAPIGGTVIKKMAVEGQYVKEGDAIYQLADLNTVWLMLKLFPEDAATIRYGQRVLAEVQSLPGRDFDGRVAFIDPNVDRKTRTVGVRVVVPNEDGRLRVGDYAKAAVDVPVAESLESPVYDPELAGKWISPRHPHIISPAPGKCPISGDDLVPTSRYGFSSEPTPRDEALVVPRDAVLMAGDESALYAESDSGRFELRRVMLGPSCGEEIVIRSGVQPGEHVATRGNFLIDSQMQLAGNPSLIDPTRAEETIDHIVSDDVIAALSSLSPEDRELVEAQEICPVADVRLGSMGTPLKVDVNGTPVFICCDGCRKSLLARPDKYLKKLETIRKDAPSTDRLLPAQPLSGPSPNEVPSATHPDHAKAPAQGDPMP